MYVNQRNSIVTLEISNKFIKNTSIDYQRMKERLPFSLRDRHFILSTLYVILFIEILYFVFVGLTDLSLILLILGLITITIRIFVFPKTNPYWAKFRQNLIDILFEKKILNPEVLSSPPLPSLITESTNIPMLIDPLNIDSTPMNLENKQNIYKDLRAIGLDGILICLFLIKNVDVFCSARNIFRSINLPQTTGYRYLKKLLENNYVFSKNTFDNPQTNYFQLTVDGKFLIYDLYKIIKY